ncbi:hypothetical protein ACQP00_27595 [Dactylosporangium sp. CS-047395]|uniref:hypothetical protein n=1 Tax=Dactylosporangium sp. CS-047395 TaxID=3239936 RepID=UPI003D8A3E93
MASSTDLGWWGRHPYFYVSFTTSIALVFWAALAFAALVDLEMALAVGGCGGVLGVPMTIAAVYAWRYLLKDRHLDERDRWNWDRPLGTVARVLVWVGFAAMLVATVDGFYDAYRFDRYGRTAEAVVTRVEPGSTFVTVAGREAELSPGRGDPRPQPGERMRVLHIPGTADVDFTDRWPYRYAFPAALIAAVLGVFALARRPGGAAAGRGRRRAAPAA